MASNSFPFLNTGHTFAVFHIDGTFIRSFEYHGEDWCYMQCHISLRTLSVKLSGPAALCGFKDNKSFLIPFSVMFMSVAVSKFPVICIFVCILCG